MVIEAGIDLLREQGIGLGVSELRYESAFAVLAEHFDEHVTRGSVNERIWANQEAWRIDVLIEAIRRSDEMQSVVIDRALVEQTRRMPIDTPSQRWMVFSETCRLGAILHVEGVARSPEYQLFVAISSAWKASTSGSVADDPLGLQLLETRRATRQRVHDRYLCGAVNLGLEPADEFGLSLNETVLFFAISSALTVSQAMRVRYEPESMRRFSATSPDGSTREWNALGRCIWAVGKSLFRPGSTRHGTAPS